MLVLGAASLLALVVPSPSPAVGPVSVDTTCIVMRMSPEGRRSPLDSLSFSVGDHRVTICYGRPSARGRTMIGGAAVPYGKLWRTGANEPTMIHTTAAVSIAGIEVDPVSYSLYTVPGEDEWVIIVNRSIDQWGHERFYVEEVKAQEVGRAAVSSHKLVDHVEAFTIRAEPAADGGATVLLEWEHTGVGIPLKAVER